LSRFWTYYRNSKIAFYFRVVLEQFYRKNLNFCTLCLSRGLIPVNLILYFVIKNIILVIFFNYRSYELIFWKSKWHKCILPQNETFSSPLDFEIIHKRFNSIHANTAIVKNNLKWKSLVFCWSRQSSETWELKLRLRYDGTFVCERTRVRIAAWHSWLLTGYWCERLRLQRCILTWWWNYRYRSDQVLDG